MLYIGIDPGESWCGFAALELCDDDRVRVEARTYSVRARNGHIGMARDIMQLLPHSKKTMVVVEDYRVRRVGHQRFSAASTLRLIGALEYAVSEIGMFRFDLIQPSDSNQKISRDLFGQVFRSYQKRWPRKSDPAWQHCHSAWRVLGMHLLKHDRDLLLSVRLQKRSHPCDRWLPVIQRSQQHDHVARAGMWVKPS